MYEIVQVTAVRGSYILKCKKSFSSTEEFDIDFLQQKYKISGIPSPTAETTVCGIPEDRKNSIMKLGSIMPADKMEFWQNMAVSHKIPKKQSSKTEVVVDTLAQRKKIPRQRRYKKEGTEAQSDNGHFKNVQSQK